MKNTFKILCYSTIFLFSMLTQEIIAQNQHQLDSLYKLINNLSNDTTKINALIKIGDLYQNSNKDSTIYYYNMALTNAIKLNSKDHIAKTYNQLGLICRSQGVMDKALDYYMKSLKIYEEIGNKKGISRCYNNIGTIHFDMCGAIDSINEFKKSEYNKAIAYYNKSLQIDKELGDIKEMSKSYNNLGSIYADLESFDTAIVCFNQSLAIRDKLNDKSGISKCYNNIGLVYFYKSDYNNALDYYFKSLKIKEEIEDINGISLVLGNIAITDIKLKKYYEAIEYANRALRIAEETGALPYQNNAVQHLAAAYDSLKNYKKVSEYQKLVIEINEKIFNEESNNQISQIEARYQFEKKQLEIDNLTKDKALNEIILAKQRNVIYSFLLGLIIIISFSILLYRQYIAKKNANIILAQKNIDIRQKNEEITIQHNEIQKQNSIIEQKNANITSSITYAKRIQSVLLPPTELIKKLIPDSFILYKPKSIVSGDFYWLDQRDQYTFIAAVDCTGHGVPGAFMSILGYNILNQALNEKQLNSPAEIINYMSVSIAKTLRQSDDDKSVHDGMDLIICRLNKSDMKLEFSGSHIPLYIIRNGILHDYKTESFSLGLAFSNKFSGFSDQSLKLEKNDMLYLFSDGYVDQFNGETDQKFSTLRFKELLVRISPLLMDEQQTILDKHFEKWKGNSDQIDDMMVIGIRI
jgi:serine phosphatase RsbU (regulator of sigma subunit)